VKWPGNQFIGCCLCW